MVTSARAQWMRQSIEDGIKHVKIEPKDAGLIRFTVDKNGIIGRDTTKSFHDLETEKMIGKSLSDVVGKGIAERILKEDEKLS